jgi:hypothetical protein
MDAQGTASFSGATGAAAGTWSKWTVYALDFTIAKSGSYSIAVTGEFAAKSPPFRRRLPEGLLHRDPNFYLEAAASWASQYIRGRGKDSGVLGVAEISNLAHFDLYRAMAGQDGNAKLAVTPVELLTDLRKTLDHAVDQAGSDAFGFGMPWEGDTATRGLALAVMASEYNFLS